MYYKCTSYQWKYAINAYLSLCVCLLSHPPCVCLTVTLQAFDKWEIDFGGPINPPGKNTGARYVITAIYYFDYMGGSSTCEGFQRRDSCAPHLLKYLDKVWMP